MSVHPLAGKLPTPDMLVSVPALVSAYYTQSPHPVRDDQRVSFGTSGHRGSSLTSTFNERHLHAITQAICDYRLSQNIDGPLFMGGDTHALSEPAFRSALEVLTANGIPVFVAPDGEYTATPVISHAILCWNAAQQKGRADGIIITPSHNPPADGGIKYNPPHGGPAETEVTSWIERRANDYLQKENTGVRRLPYMEARRSSLVRIYDFTSSYVDDLETVIDMQAIAASGLRLGVDPLGGASLSLWDPIARRYGLNLHVVNRQVDPTFRFIPCDRDGKIRMDCSSPYAMRGLLDMRQDYDLAFGCDPDSDRHGIVTADGLMNPNHYLAVASWYLFQNRPHWPAACGIGKTLVTSAMLDRVGEGLNRPVIEVPVGFKWFVPYLESGRCGLGCEESAGASFLTRDGKPWSTDKDGPLLCLLAAEIMARQKKAPSALYTDLTSRYGSPVYERIDMPATPAMRAVLKKSTPEQIPLTELAGEPVQAVQTHAPGNNAPVGGIKISSSHGWFAMRPSGTEDICKIYAESFLGREHLQILQETARKLLDTLLSPEHS